MLMSSSSAALSTPEGPGSGAPNLPEGFTDTFTSRYVDTGGLHQHAVIGGDGPPLLLVHGWPENWYAWRLVMPALARDFEVIAVDQRDIGLSDKPEDGYDTDDLVALKDALGHERFAVVGHATGLIIGYALAADHPDRVVRLAEAEVPGPLELATSPPMFVPKLFNHKLWHIPFNRVNDELTEQLITGREGVFFGYEFAIQGGKERPMTRSTTTSVCSLTRMPCAAASGSTGRSTSPSNRTSSARPGRSRCPSWRSAERKAGVRRSGTE
jgi:pimeloyl-ACP methyl ester carboxylesterase